VKQACLKTQLFYSLINKI